MSQTKNDPQQQNKPRQKRRNDFNIGSIIGHGAFGEVVQVEDKETGIHYAMKILSKAHVIREKKMNYVTSERDAMTRLHHPNILRLFLTFQDKANLYFVIELAQNGDLQKVLDHYYSIDIDISKILLGQILLAIAHIHKNKIIHRDIKPENILLDSSNRVKITDFGTAKLFGKDEVFLCERGSFVGSADYVSPETIKETSVGPATDLWSYGCLIYTLLVGRAPFHAESNYNTFINIENNKYELPSFLPEDAKDLISKILISDPEKRLGCNSQDTDYEPIRNHPFFAGINWNEISYTPISGFKSYLPAIEASGLSETILHNQNIVNSVLIDNEKVIHEGNVTILHQQNDLSDFTDDDESDMLFEMKGLLMVLTDHPRLLLISKNNSEIEAEIDLTVDLTVKKDGPSRITIGTCHFLADESEIDKWVELIKNQINLQAKNE